MKTVSIQTDSINLTEEQFFRLCMDNRKINFERDKHKNIIIMAPTGTLMGNQNLDVATEVAIWNKKHKLGFCFDSNTGYTLPDGSVFSPDVSWISKARWEKVPLEDKKRFAHICPDFVIELMSESDSLKEAKGKMKDWMSNGCKLGWLIDIKHKTTYIYKPKTKTTESSFKKKLSGGKILPKFELLLSEILS